MYLILTALAAALAVFYLGLRELLLADRDRRRREAAVVPEEHRSPELTWRGAGPAAAVAVPGGDATSRTA